MQESVKQDRDKYIGGSDIPIIMNLSPFKSRYHLLLEKAGYREDTFEGNQFTEYGNVMEEKIRDYVNKSFPKTNRFKEGKHEINNPDMPINYRAHTDGENNLSVLEIKTTSKIYDKIEDYKIYLVQLLFYMVVSSKTSGLLAVYERPEDLSEEFDPERLHRYSIERFQYEDLIAEIFSEINKFMEDLEKVRKNPFISEEDLLPAEIPDITARILAFESQLQFMKDIEEQIKREKLRLFRAMESASVKTWKTPNGYRITRVDGSADSFEKKKYFDEVSFKKDKPDLYEEYVKEKTVEKKGRAGYIKITAPSDKEAE